MRYLSLFSGIEAASLAWAPLGWTPVGFSEVDPFCCELLKQRFPGVPNLGDVTAEDFVERARGLGKIDLIVGGSPCFPAGALVLSRRGLVPIEEIRIGDEVLTHAGRYRRVCVTGARDAEETVLVKGQGHEGLVVTPEHPILSRSFRRVGFQRDEHNKAHPHREWSTPEWTPAREMFHRFWAQATSFPASEVPAITKEAGERIVPEFTLAFWWMVGAYLGNGWTRGGQRSGRPEGQEAGGVIICAGPHKADAMERELARTGLTWTRVPQRTAVRFVTGSRALRRWMEEHFGKYAAGKTIPAWLLGQPEDVRRAVLAGYTATDGSESDKLWSTTTVSRRLAYGLKLLWHSLRRSVSVLRHVPRREHVVIEGRVVNELPQYHVTAYQHARSAVLLDGLWYGCVRKVIPGGTATRVYNLEVEEDNSYTVDGIVVHNCQSFSIAGLRKGLHDDRGNLTLRFVEVVRELNPEWVVWENVPGILSHSDNPFGCFLAGLVGADAPLVPPGRGRWANAGLVAGPQRVAAFRVLDAQWFSVPQRRRRVFVLAGRSGDYRCSPLLLEFPGLRGNPSSRRPPGQGATHDVAPCLGASGRGVERGGDPRGQDPVVAVQGVALGPESQEGERPTGGVPGSVVACFGGGRTKGELDVATARSAHAGSRDDFDSDTFVAEERSAPEVAHSLRADGFDASEDGTGRGTPLVPIDLRQSSRGELDTNDRAVGSGGPPGVGVGEPGDPAFTVSERGQAVGPVAYQCHGTNVGPMGTVRKGDGGATSGIPCVASFDPVNVTSKANRSRVDPSLPCHFLHSGGAPAVIGSFEQNSMAGRGTLGWSEGGDGPLRPVKPQSDHQFIAFSSKDHGADAGEVSPTLRAAGYDGSHANAGAPPAVAFYPTGGSRSVEATEDCSPPIKVGSGLGIPSCLAIAFHATQDPISGDISPCMGRGNKHGTGSIAVTVDTYNQTVGETCQTLRDPHGTFGDALPAVAVSSPEDKQRVLAPALTAYNMDSRSPQSAEQTHTVEAVHAASMMVRRLTARECERLQGMPDDWTLVTIRGKPAADGPRYKAIGNSMAVPCMAWIGRRIAAACGEMPVQSSASATVGGQAGPPSAVAEAFPIQESGKRTGKSTDDPKAGIGIGESGAPSYALGADSRHAVAFSTKESDRDATVDIAPTLRAESGDPHMGGRMAVATEVARGPAVPTMPAVAAVSVPAPSALPAARPASTSVAVLPPPSSPLSAPARPVRRRWKAVWMAPEPDAAALAASLDALGEAEAPLRR